MTTMPAVSLSAVPGRRKQTLELAAEIERHGFSGIYSPSFFAGMDFCNALCFATKEIPFGTSIAPIYMRPAEEYAQSAALIHELSGGRFRFGIGVSHGPMLKRMGIVGGKPLQDTRAFAERYRATQGTGDKAPLILASMRKKMIALGGELGDGIVFANAVRSHMKESLAALPAAKRDDPNFFIGDMIPTVVDDDVEAAKRVHRRTLTNYVRMPNYRNYWREAGFAQEMADIEAAMANKDEDGMRAAMSDHWLSENTLFGPAAKVREGVEAWLDTGVRTPILVPSSANGNQIKALEELFAAFR
jgi:alkanesulfonate monooxygenase SsuD/methylene tetrahydromethanopterin reductase-like flavin-dependent oxidoreductase (luciferase family)